MTLDYSREEVLELLNGLCSEVLTAEQRERLERILLGSPEARQLYFDFLDVHLGLRQWQIRESARQVPLKQGAPRELTEIDHHRGGNRIRRVLSYASVVAATLILAGFIQWLWWSDREISSDPAVAASQDTPEAYVATLRETSGCVWDDASSRTAGWRLMPGALRLKKGVAEIRFDGGATLVIEGPVSLSIQSDREATLVAGQVVFRGDEISDGFSLNTPDATLMDLGTEYALAVTPGENNEVHVFAGLVRRTLASGSKPGVVEELTAGEARRFGPGIPASGEPVPLAKEKFVRRAPPTSSLLHDPRDEPLVSEGFDYPARALPMPDGKDAGVGWHGSWFNAKGKPRDMEIVPDAEDEIFPSPPGKNGSHLRQTGAGEIGRQLAHPLRLDLDSVCYLSFVVQWDGSDTRKFFQLRINESGGKYDESRLLRVGMAHVARIAQVSIDLGGEQQRAQMPLEAGNPYLLVAKVVTGRDRPAQAFVLVHRLGLPLGRQEPFVWTLSSVPVRSDAVLDELWFLTRGEGTQLLDELRIGRTWASVTAPWQNGKTVAARSVSERNPDGKSG